MTFAAVKEKLHEYIDHAGEKKIKAIYTLIENEIGHSNYFYDDETVNMLEERKAEFQKDTTKGLTVKESMQYVKKQLGENGL